VRLHPQSLHVCERNKVEEGDRERQRSARHETTMTRETAIQRGEGARYGRESCGLESGDSSLRRRGSDVCGQPVPARLRARARSSAGRSSRTQLGGSELAVLGHLAPDRTAAPRASRPTRADRESPGPGSRAGYLLLDRDETTGTNSTKKPQCPPRIRRARRDEPRGPAPVRGYTLHKHT
jgi:hypothetical protein